MKARRLSLHAKIEMATLRASRDKSLPSAHPSTWTTTDLSRLPAGSRQTNHGRERDSWVTMRGRLRPLRQATSATPQEKSVSTVGRRSIRVTGTPSPKNGIQMDRFSSTLSVARTVRRRGPMSKWSDSLAGSSRNDGSPCDGSYLPTIHYCANFV